MREESFTIECARCGGSRFEIPNDPKPDDVVRCVGCGATPRYRDIQSQALQAERKRVQDVARNLFKKRR